MVNCNPETVSTDYDTSSRLYFEPLTAEDVNAVIDAERRTSIGTGRLAGVIVSLGGQTPLKLAHDIDPSLVLGTPPASIDDPAFIQAGARAFEARGCVKCHGAPGVNWEKFSEGMRPYPADLKETAPQRTAAEIFYVIKNGIKMTGMPSFGSTGVPDDEMWKIAAFVKKIPTTTDADYKAWSAAP